MITITRVEDRDRSYLNEYNVAVLLSHCMVQDNTPGRTW